VSLRKETSGATLATTDSVPDFERMDELWHLIQDVGITGMSTSELEEWTYLMARSLEGKGNGPVR